LGTTVTYKICIDEEIKSTVNHSVQNIFYTHLLSKNLKLVTYKIIILLAVLNGCKTWSLTLREEHIDWGCLRMMGG
jgi:hypothetical protein